jgi:membrane-associated protease RseP (regulator of RpoE activity)
MGNAFIIWLILLAGFYFAYSFGARAAAAKLAVAQPAAPPSIPAGVLAAFERKLEPILAITGHKGQGGILQFEGKLRGKAEEMFSKIREAFRADPVTPMLLEGEGHDVRVLFLPSHEQPVQENSNWLLHASLFLAALATTTWAGALHAGVNLLQQPERFSVGLPYSLGLMLILGAHEMGHYITARRYGIQVTPPFFIPVPFALGTFGAFIKIKSLTPNRRALFDVAVAGPMAGLVFAVPALLIGLRSSQIIPGNAPLGLVHYGVSASSSVLLACFAKVSLGASVSADHHLALSPLAFAGWLGLMVTALNLLPIGQLDGGHIAHAVFGARHARGISLVALACLFLLALFVWPGLILWAFVVYFIAGTQDAPAANDVTPLDFPRRALAYLTFAILLVIIVPVPRALFEAFGLHSPYL